MQSLINLNELLAMTEINQFKGVNARQLHQALRVGRDYSTWIKARIQQGRFIEEQDFIIAQNAIIDLPKLASTNEQNLNSPKRGSANNKQLSKVRVKQGNEYIVSLDMAKHLCLMEKNEIGQAIRQHFINAEKALAEVAPSFYRNTLKASQQRLASIDYQHELTKALENALVRHGKSSQPKYFINEAKMLNSLTVGVNIKEWQEQNGITGNPRNQFKATQLEVLSELTKADIALINLDMPYQERKERLEALSERLRGVSQ